MEATWSQRSTPPLGQSRSLPMLVPLQAKRESSVRPSPTAPSKARPPAFFDSMDRLANSEAILRSSAGQPGPTSPLGNAGHVHVMFPRSRLDTDLLDRMGYHGPLFKNANNHKKREACLHAQKEGEINAFRSALRGALLHLGQDDPFVIHMRSIMKEADWGVRTCKKCTVGKLANVVQRMNDMELGPRKWENPDLFDGRRRLTAHKASLTKSEDEETRKNAIDALAALGLAATQHAPEVADCLADDSLENRAAVIQCLKNMEEAGAKAAADHLADEKLIMRKQACEALGQMGDLGARHANQLALHFHDEQAEMRKFALLAFQSFGPAAADHAKEVAVCLNDTDWMVRRTACLVLGGMGAEAATEVILNMLSSKRHDEEGEVRKAAQDALFSLSSS